MRIYTRELLDKYLLPELKEIAQGFGISPEGDKRCRQNWIGSFPRSVCRASPGADCTSGYNFFYKRSRLCTLWFVFWNDWASYAR
jgi:hypothetical protein